MGLGLALSRHQLQEGTAGLQGFGFLLRAWGLVVLASDRYISAFGLSSECAGIG